MNTTLKLKVLKSSPVFASREDDFEKKISQSSSAASNPTVKTMTAESTPSSPLCARG